MTAHPHAPVVPYEPAAHADRPRCCTVCRTQPTRSGGPAAVVRCASCGSWFTTPRPAAAEIAALYPDSYAPYRTSAVAPAFPPTRGATPDQAPPRWRDRWWDRLTRTRRGMHHVRPFGDGRLLDVGCGGGDFLAAAERLGWHADGIDLSAAAVATAAGRTRGRVWRTDLAAAGERLAENRYDLITLWQVLEHVERPLDVLRSVRRTLAPGGRLMLAVPNRASLSAWLFGSAWIGWDVPRHATHWNAGTLADLLARAGFDRPQVVTVSRPGWIRHSARGTARARRLAATGFAARTIGRGAQFASAGDCLYTLARIPKADVVQRAA